MGSFAEVPKPEYLAEQMALRGLDCAGLARQINVAYGTKDRPKVVSRQMISKLKNGTLRTCTPLLAQRIATVLGVIPTAIFLMDRERNTAAHSAPVTTRRARTRAAA